ncbi:MAG: hypothetical protein NC120_02690 [Ruminococcus sp.]|nr:hypothetical protein [Ruminococcus sp.]
MKAKKALKLTAKKAGSSYADVRREIQAAVEAAVNSGDPEAAMFMEQIPKKGRIPTPEEIIEYAVSQLKQSSK